MRRCGTRDCTMPDTAATVLSLLSVPERIVMEFMGWSNAAMAKRDQHVTVRLWQYVARQLNGLLWGNE